MKKLFDYSIKYPKFTREENRCCKLTDSEITEIKSFYSQHRKEFKTNKEVYEHLAERYNVHYQTIHYWCKPEYRNKVIEVSTAKVRKEWESKDGHRRALERGRRLKKDWRERKGDRFKEYGRLASDFYNQCVRKFIKENKQEFMDFMKANEKLIKH